MMIVSLDFSHLFWQVSNTNGSKVHFGKCRLWDYHLHLNAWNWKVQFAVTFPLLFWLLFFSVVLANCDPDFTSLSLLGLLSNLPSNKTRQGVLEGWPVVSEAFFRQKAPKGHASHDVFSLVKKGLSDLSWCRSLLPHFLPTLIDAHYYCLLTHSAPFLSTSLISFLSTFAVLSFVFFCSVCYCVFFIIFKSITSFLPFP